MENSVFFHAIVTFLSSHFQYGWNRLKIGWTFVVKEWKTMDFTSMKLGK
jgi:hypothetical protein